MASLVTFLLLAIPMGVLAGALGAWLGSKVVVRMNRRP